MKLVLNTARQKISQLNSTINQKDQIINERNTKIKQIKGMLGKNKIKDCCKNSVRMLFKIYNN
jgi:uncharacterized protein (DUF3084 family)